MGCRSMCCFIFVMSTTEDLFRTIRTWQMLWYIPSEPQPWMEIEKADSFDDSCTLSTSDIRIRIAGMPRHWKLLNLLVISLPKLILWKLTTNTGTSFLMSTAGIDNLIVNSVGLGLILSLDDFMCVTFMSEHTKECMQRCEAFPLASQVDLNRNRVMTQYGHTRTRSSKSWKCRDFLGLIPWKLVITGLLT